MKLSELEQEIMHLVWRDKEVIVPELHQEIARSRDISYATVKTTVNRLEEKGVLKRVRTYGRTIVYAPLIREQAIVKPIVKNVLRRLFGDQARPMISHLLQVEKLSLEDLEYLKGQIDDQLESRERKP